MAGASSRTATPPARARRSAETQPSGSGSQAIGSSKAAASEATGAGLPPSFRRLAGCYFFLLLAIAYVGILNSVRGRTTLLKLEGSLKSWLIQVPLSQRGCLWQAAEAIEGLGLQLPLFVLGFGGDRLAYYDAMHEALGDISPFVGGVALFKYKAVSDILISTDQPRGQYIGARVVPDRCMVPSTLIFMSTGTNHSKMRSFMIQQLKALKKGSHDKTLLPEPAEVGDVKLADDSWIKRSIIRNLWRRLFQEAPSQSTEDNLFQYYTWGGTCVLGKTFHTLTFNYALAQLDLIRTKAYDDALATKVGAEFKLKAEKELGFSEAEAKEALQQLVDGFMFAGLLGTSHLVAHTLDRIRQNPALYVPMWRNNKQTFLLESARVDPPVTSVTAVLGEATELSVGSGFRGTGATSISFEAGSTVQLSISAANRDPAVFGGPAKSKARANSFDPTRPKQELKRILSWNGVHQQVMKGQAPRGCIGYFAGFETATLIIQRFLPAVGVEVGESDARQMAKKQREDLDDDEDDSAFGLGQSLLNGKIAYSIWMICCLLFILHIKLTGATEYGLVSGRYAHYLAAQAVLSFGVLMDYRVLVEHGMVQSAYGYYQLGFVCRAFFRHKSYYSIADGKKGEGLLQDTQFLPVYAPGIPTVSVLTISTHALLFALRYTFSSDYMYYDYICYAFYTPAALMVMLSIFQMWRTEKDLALKAHLGLGVVGGFFGIINLIWPFYVLGGTLFNLISRIADSVLYVPLATWAVEAADESLQRGIHAGARGSDAVAEELKKKAAAQKSNMRKILALTIVVLLCALAIPAGQRVISGGQLCFFEEDFVRFKEPCEVGAEILEKTDRHTRTLYRVLKQFATPRGVPVPNGSRVMVPTDKRVLPKLRLFYGNSMPTWDEDYPEGAGVVSALIFEFLRLEALNPLVDSDVEWESADQAKQLLATSADTDLEALKILRWDEMTSDSAITKWAFAGIGAHMTKRVESGDAVDGKKIVFVNDWDWMASLDVRPGFEHYGATAYFAADGGLLKIWWSHGHKNVTAKDADEWEHAKWAFKCSAISGVTLRDHLVGLHFMASNFLATAVFERLGPDHPIRRMLRPHTFGAVTINLGATKTLAVERGVLHRASAFTWDAVKTGFFASYNQNRWSGDFRVQMEAHGMMETIRENPDLYPFGQDAIEFVEVVQKFVGSYVDIYYADNKSMLLDRELVDFWDGLHVVDGSRVPSLSGKEVLVDVLANWIAYVTGFHNHAGGVADYLLDPSFASAKIRPNRNIADIQATFQGLNIGLMTAQPAVRLLSDFKHLLLNDIHLPETTKVFDSFQRDLAALSAKINERNKNRSMPCNSLNPELMVSSISI